MRAFWRETMLKIADPVLRNLAQGRLKTAMPPDFHPDREDFRYLEALGRTLCGMAPWLELAEVPEEERALQAEYRELARQAIAQATNPASPDFMNFSKGYGQALVDAAFLAHGILRAPTELWEKLPGEAQANLANALEATRTFVPYVSNWLLFSAMIEAALHRMGRWADQTRMEYAIRMFERWYVGDGLYSDGDRFHLDYYNSFVIHPMLIDVLREAQGMRWDYQELLNVSLKRGSRCAAHLERLVSLDGTFPVIGRSMSYRFGAFQLLSQAALQHFLPDGLPPAQARCALDAVLRRVMSAPGNFDEGGWLTPGMFGCQPGLADGYISIGSLYLCQSAFLALGLPASDPFWADPDQPWTQKRIWSGEDVRGDYAND